MLNVYSHLGIFVMGLVERIPLVLSSENQIRVVRLRLRLEECNCCQACYSFLLIRILVQTHVIINMVIIKEVELVTNQSVIIRNNANLLLI